MGSLPKSVRIRCQKSVGQFGLPLVDCSAKPNAS